MAAVKAASAAFFAFVAACRSQVGDWQIGHLVVKASLLRGIHGRVVKSITVVGDIGGRNSWEPSRQPRTLRVTLALGCFMGCISKLGLCLGVRLVELIFSQRIKRSTQGYTGIKQRRPLAGAMFAPTDQAAGLNNAQCFARCGSD